MARSSDDARETFVSVVTDWVGSHRARLSRLRWPLTTELRQAWDAYWSREGHAQLAREDEFVDAALGWIAANRERLEARRASRDWRHTDELLAAFEQVNAGE